VTYQNPGILGPQYASGTSDDNGNVTLQFQAPSAQQAWTGTITVPGAPSIAVWTLLLNGQAQSSWNGSTMAGPFVCSSSGVMTLIGTLLPPNTQVQAVWNAQLAGAPYAGPQPVAPLSVALTSLGTFDFTSASGTPQVTLQGIPGDTVALAVLLDGPYPGTISPLVFGCQGAQSGAFYTGKYGANVLNGNGSADNSTGPPCVVPFSGLFDNAAYMTFSVPPSLAQYEISVFALPTLPDLGPAKQIQTVYANITPGATATLLDLGTGPSGPLILKAISWTAIPADGANAGNIIFTDNNGAGNFYAPLTPAIASGADDQYEVTGDHDFADSLLPWYEGGSHRTITATAPTDCFVSVAMTFQRLDGDA
jgi:hypothetical protein